MPTQHGGQLDFSKTDYISASYRLNKLTPRDGSIDITVSTAGGQESNFDLISRPFNLARSILSFTYAPTAKAANYNKCFMDCLAPIRQIQLLTRGGVYLCDINEVGNITKMIWKPETSMADFLALENHDNGSGAGSMLQKCNASTTFQPVSDAKRLAALETALTASALAGTSQANIQDGIDVAKAQVQAALQAWMGQPATNARRHDDALIAAETGASKFVNVAYNEAKYFSGGAVNTAEPSINVKINLGMLYNTIFALDKTIMFPEILTLRIVWQQTPKIFYYNNDALSTGGGTVAAADTDVKISNLNLFLAVETNPDVIQSIQQKIMSPEGMSFNIDYSYLYKNTVGTPSSSQNVIIRFDRGHGRRIKKIYHSVFNTEESKNTAYDNSNLLGSKVQTFYTTMDGARLQEFNVDCQTGKLEDYMYLKPKLEGGVLMNSNVYQYNWVWCDSFDNTRPLWSKDQNEISGLSLDTERRWEFIATTATIAANHYTFVVTQQEVNVKNGTITRN